MTLTFLNPFLLLGVAAAALPILIHRIAHQRPAARKFSAVRLLLQSRPVTARPQRLKNLLLLALRILAVATMVFMMARPILVHPDAAALLTEGAKVLIFDNSLSMGYTEERGRRFDLAKSAARLALKGFNGQVAVLPTVRVPQTQGGGWLKPQEALKALDTLPLSFARGNPESAFISAYRQLKDLKIPSQILILSDMARGDWQDLDLSRLGTVSEAEVIFFRTGGAGRDPNFRIKAVRLAKDEMTAGVPARLEVTVSNLSDQSGSRLVELYLADRKVDQKSIELTPGRDGKLFFDLLVDKAGWMNGVVKLSPDRLPGDDEFYFTVRVMPPIHILVVDGDPKTSLKAAESYFLVSALHPGALQRSPFVTSVVTASEMGRVDLRFYDVIFLLNVARPDFSRLASFLETGRPVFFFLGDRIVPEAYNRFSLAPWQIRARIDLGEPAAGANPMVSSGNIPPFLSALAHSLQRSVVRTYFRVEGRAETFLTLANQDPLLTAAPAGKSRVFLFVSSADLAWNDLPLSAGYLPLLQGLVKEAVGWKQPSAAAAIRLGEPFAAQGHPFQMQGPRGGPGIFQFSLPAGEVRQAVNTPLEESDLAKVAPAELAQKFGSADVKVIEYPQAGLAELPKGRRELWPALLGFLLAVLAVEMILANGVPRFGGEPGAAFRRKTHGVN